MAPNQLTVIVFIIVSNLALLPPRSVMNYDGL